MAKYLANGTYGVKRGSPVIAVLASVPVNRLSDGEISGLTVRSYLNEQSSPP